MNVEKELEQFEANMRANHPTLSDSSVDFFVRRKRTRLELEQADG